MVLQKPWGWWESAVFEGWQGGQSGWSGAREEEDA